MVPFLAPGLQIHEQIRINPRSIKIYLAKGKNLPLIYPNGLKIQLESQAQERETHVTVGCDGLDPFDCVYLDYTYYINILEDAYGC